MPTGTCWRSRPAWKRCCEDPCILPRQCRLLRQASAAKCFPPLCPVGMNSIGTPRNRSRLTARQAESVVHGGGHKIRPGFFGILVFREFSRNRGEGEESPTISSGSVVYVGGTESRAPIARSWPGLPILLRQRKRGSFSISFERFNPARPVLLRCGASTVPSDEVRDIRMHFDIPRFGFPASRGEEARHRQRRAIDVRGTVGHRKASCAFRSP